MKVKKGPHFDEWLNTLTIRDQRIISARLDRIRDFGYLGDYHEVDKDIWELRWKQGWRIYFIKVRLRTEEIIILLLGGNKNGQEKDIKKARALYSRYTSG